MTRYINTKMSELIDKGELKTAICIACSNGVIEIEGCVSDDCTLLKLIDDQPTIEAEPVRHGRWIFVGEETMHDGWTYRKHKCTECDYVTVEVKNFCQNCGAKMSMNESWFTDTFSQCDNCPDWDGGRCKSNGHGCEW